MSESVANGRTAQAAVRSMEFLMHRRLYFGLLAILLAGQIACVDADKAGTGDTVLYVHQATDTSTKIQVFTDTGVAFSGTGDLTPNYSLTHSLLDQALPLAWGGMALDSGQKRLYLVSEKGAVVRIERLDKQTGLIPLTEAHSFTLKNGDRLSGISTFGQAAYANNNLYVSETNDSGTSQIWKISNPHSYTGGAEVPLTKVELAPGDKGGTGLAADDSNIYGFFNEGSNIFTPPSSWTGPRMRRTSTTQFPVVAIGGDATLIGKYGSLALDTSGSNWVYLARHNTASSASGDPQPVLVFKAGDFQIGGGSNVSPSAKLGNGTEMGDLRVLAHAGKKDWLGALSSSGDTSFNFFWLWKAPSVAGAVAVKKTIPGAGIRGLALDGKP